MKKNKRRTQKIHDFLLERSKGIYKTDQTHQKQRPRIASDLNLFTGVGKLKHQVEQPSQCKHIGEIVGHARLVGVSIRVLTL